MTFSENGNELLLYKDTMFAQSPYESVQLKKLEYEDADKRRKGEAKEKKSKRKMFGKIAKGVLLAGGALLAGKALKDAADANGGIKNWLTRTAGQNARKDDTQNQVKKLEEQLDVEKKYGQDNPLSGFKQMKLRRDIYNAKMRDTENKYANKNTGMDQNIRNLEKKEKWDNFKEGLNKTGKGIKRFLWGD